MYQSTVPRLRIALRTGSIGALFKVLINGIEVWSGDSYSPIVDLIDQTFDMSAETEPYTVRIEHDGIGGGGGSESKLEVVRGSVVADMVQTILRADPEGCGVQWSLDDGGSWDTIDLSECIGGIADDRIQQAIEDGTITGPGQQSPQSPPLPGSCNHYTVHLDAKDIWHCPSPIKTDDNVTVTIIGGGWWDGVALEPWHCADGHYYLLGACTSGTDTAPTDPMPAEPHMQIVGHYDATFFEPLAASYTVPASVPETELFFQANDGTLSDNMGSVDFEVDVCTGGWCKHYDFTVSDQGFEPMLDDPYGSNWQSDGWHAGLSGNGNTLQIFRGDMLGLHMTGIRMVGIQYNYRADAPGYAEGYKLSGAWTNFAHDVPGEFDLTGVLDGTEKDLQGLSIVTVGTPANVLTHLYVWGTGTAAPGGDTC